MEAIIHEGGTVVKRIQKVERSQEQCNLHYTGPNAKLSLLKHTLSRNRSNHCGRVKCYAECCNKLTLKLRRKTVQDSLNYGVNYGDQNYYSANKYHGPQAGLKIFADIIIYRDAILNLTVTLYT
jgi:hypothetical protein